MKSTKLIVWNELVSKRVAVFTASKELDEAMIQDGSDYEGKYTAWENAKYQKNLAELAWKEYNAVFN